VLLSSRKMDVGVLVVGGGGWHMTQRIV